ncbi:hypothetical protein JIN77_09095 [Verrucomicrobiaceae bacterium R5-34]|nr:hypothetical protein [Verrucomicrobiaceae bacterium R5-34]
MLHFRRASSSSSATNLLAVFCCGWLLASCSPMDTVPGESKAQHPTAASHDLLAQSRQWVTAVGRPQARDQLSKALARQDQSDGQLERRLFKTNAEKDYIFPESLATMPRAERNKTGVYFVLGFNQDKGRSPPIIRRTVQHMNDLGFRAKFIDVASRQTADNDASVIAKALRQELPKVERAMLLGFSRGSTDLVHFWHGPAHDIPAEELRKIRLWANFAGVLRGSEVARWGALGHDPLAWGFRCFLNWREGAPRTSSADLASIGYDKWQYPGRGFPEAVRDDITVINFVSLPDGTDGWPEEDRHFKWLASTAARQGRVIGPCDGLVESAASILPPQTGIEQWIVRVHGSHSLLGGRYMNGKPVAARYHEGQKNRLQSGVTLLDDFVRAVPKSSLE